MESSQPTKPPSVEGVKAQIDFTRLVITLSTGAIAFTITFLDKFRDRPDNTAIDPTIALYACWLLLGIAVVMALLTLMALAGTLDAIDRKSNGWSVTEEQDKAATGDNEHVRWSALGMVLFFVLGLMAMIATGLR